MNPEVAIDVFKSTLLFSLYMAAPFLLGMMIVGLLMSLFQSVTSIQEPTLTFAPKLLAFAGLVLLLAPWLLRVLGEFTISVIARMGSMGH
jgi:flagellar biosynthesis protein FliQ